MPEITLDQCRPLFAWMAERHAIYMRKHALQTRGVPPLSAYGDGWWGAGEWRLDNLTSDLILRQFKFCNVYRELDRVTIWIREHIREPFSEHPDLWFMLAAARWINWPPAMKDLMYQTAYSGGTAAAWPIGSSFSLEKMGDVLAQRRGRGDKVFTGAYLITNNGVSMPKERYVTERVLGSLWAQATAWRDFLDNYQGQLTMQYVHETFTDGRWMGFGSFMSGQITTDMRHTRYLSTAPDRATWAAVGPGSARGLNRLLGRPVDQRLKQDQALDEMRQIQQLMGRPDSISEWLQATELTDLQNCCCEFDKYERVRLGEGRPRALYVPGRGY